MVCKMTSITNIHSIDYLIFNIPLLGDILIKNFNPLNKTETNNLRKIIIYLERYYPNVVNWFNNKIKKISLDELKHYKYLLVYHENEIIAYCLAEMKKNERVKISSLYVCKNFRNKGIGKLLLTHQLDYWRNYTKSITVTFSSKVILDYPFIVDFFEKFGFRKIKEISDLYITDETETICSLLF